MPPLAHARGSNTAKEGGRRDRPGVAELAGERLQEIIDGRVVAECLAHVGIAVDIAGGKHEGPAELERIASELNLFVSCRLRALTSLRVVAPEDVEQVALFQ